jgi:lipid II:glycine glycyltransferase (peptidoglycan interpeptide bridge formation enzyme)
MNCETRKKHGLPPQPFLFFENIYKNVISIGMGEILFAVKDEAYIAGALYLKFGKKLLYKFGASYAKHYESRGNNFVMWEAIKKYSSEGFEEFDFGRTEINHEGLRRFKLGWNTEEHFIYTTRFDVNINHFLPADIHTEGFHNKIFNNTPVWLLKIIGNILYKHIG